MKVDPEKRKKEARKHYLKHRETLIEKQKRYYRAHKEEKAAYDRRYFAEHREELTAEKRAHYVRTRQIVKEQQLKRFYGLDWKQYQQMKVDQGGKCAICHKKPTGTKAYLCVDHDHATGLVRGLLCNRCNLLVGHLENNMPLAIPALQYLRKYQQAPAQPPTSETANTLFAIQ